MDDSLLVSRAAAGDLDSFGQLYDRHFNRVYDFAWRTLRDADAAAEATRETFTQVARALPALAKSGDFRTALFTTAHNIVVTSAERLRIDGNGRAGHEEAFGTFEAPDPCLVDDPRLTGGDQELPCLVWEALVELNARDYALLDLHVRQELPPAAIAAVIGASRGNAATMVQRMTQAAEDVVRGYVVARRGGKDCDDLRGILAQHTFPPYSDAVRDAVSAHLKTCETCQRTAALPAAPLAIFAAFAVASAPFVLKGEVWRSLVEAAAPAAVPAMAGAGAGVPAAPPPGAPPPYAGGAGSGGSGGMGLAYPGAGEDATRRNMILFAAAAVGMLVFAFIGGILIAGALGGDGGAAGDGTATVTATATAADVVTTTPGVVIDTPTPDPNPSPTPEPPTPEPTPTAPPPPPPPTSTPIVVPTVAPPTPVPAPTNTPAGGQPSLPIVPQN
jgi:RNA polymerase sigma factor (sigma-70 family)